MRKIFTIFVYLFAIIGFALVAVYFAVQFGLTNTPGIIDRQRDSFKNEISRQDGWIESKEWIALKEIIKKDADVIDKVSKQTRISSRMIVAPLVVEQLRLFTSERELFKSVFAPLKVLGNQSQFSWGIMGIKQETAKKIEENLKDSSSPWYLGKEYEHILDFTVENVDSDRFYRLTNEYDRTYSYLYTALCIKELITQWQRAGINIENRPDILATLFNIGFDNSKPHENPDVGGAEIEINKTNYSFGGLAQSFYDSSELTDVFPK